MEIVPVIAFAKPPKRASVARKPAWNVGFLAMLPEIRRVHTLDRSAARQGMGAGPPVLLLYASIFLPRIFSRFWGGHAPR